MPYQELLRLQLQFSRLESWMPNHRQLQALCILCRLHVSNIVNMGIFNMLIGLFLNNCTGMEFENTYAYYELVCFLENSRFCGEACFEGAALYGYLPLTAILSGIMKTLWRFNLVLVLGHTFE
jgi:hypothetical protein